MNPQSNFMVVAPIAAGREDALRQLLVSMNRAPGVVDPLNRLIPFGQLKQLHFARVLILSDLTLDDITAYGLARVDYPLYLAFLGDFDGDFDEFLAELITHADTGLRLIFSHCVNFTDSVDLLQWMKARNCTPLTIYVNWIGRTVQQVHEESALRDALEVYIEANRAEITRMQSRQVYDALRSFAAEERKAGRLTLTPAKSTPVGWQLRNALHLIGVPLLLLALSPFLLIYSAVFLYQLRRRELTDPEIAPRIDPAHAKELAELEDHDVSNQFSAFGSVKPGIFRRWTLIFFLWAINYTTRHIFNHGRLARVSTIHFARWVFLDNKKRLFFASNYDGSLDSYMDDFINKVAFGLNLVFSNGIGYPTTNWLIADGAKDEQKFKYYIRRHELPTEVWYKAYPGLTTLDLERNALIRQGFEATSLNDSEIQQWLQLF